MNRDELNEQADKVIKNLPNDAVEIILTKLKSMVVQDAEEK